MSERSWRGKKVLITGGLGFIGSNLAQVLVQQDAEIVILDALLPPYGGNPFNIYGIEDRVKLIDGDIRDVELMNRLVGGMDFIFHLAGQVSYLDSKDKPFDDLDFNGRSNLVLLEAVRRFAPQARIVFTSSRLVYGKIKQLPVSESHPTEPLSLYGIHKLLGEKYYSYYAKTFDIPGMSVRIPNPYGPRQQMRHSKYSIVGWFVRQAMEGATLTVYGDGSQARDYLYIDDIIDALLKVAEIGEAGEVYNIGTDERVRFDDMVDAVLRAVGTGTKAYVPWPEDYEKNETGDYFADTTKLHMLTGWRPKVSLEEGIQRMVDYYQEHREYYW